MVGILSLARLADLRLARALQLLRLTRMLRTKTRIVARRAGLSDPTRPAEQDSLLVDIAAAPWQHDGQMDRTMKLTIELDREADGRWIADIPELPGVMKYGATRAAAIQAAMVLALQVIASEIEHGERSADIQSIEFAPAVETAKVA